MADKTAEQRSMQVADDAIIDVATSQLSAMVDEELDGMEVDLALRRLCRDGDLQARWERYHLISDVMQGHMPAAFDANFAARLHQAIEDEPLPRPAARPLPAWYKPVTGFALAASVVLVALFGLKLTQTDANPTATTVPIANASPTRTPTLPVQVAALSTAVNPASAANDPVEARLGSYLVNHNGYASMNSMHGMLPYVRMVGYQQSSSR
ncbi:MAG TPA: RseA family anti-sigma factor [Candidatus Competibacteraceae bacterium]|nr:RseA family anti-sigma factor [Candidatus Competibacteraceae bacterium]HQA25632.1 RseA family anti-sigma factor [Candidatus Competibacteraceae bacterium]HQD57082.1 RseA family anti-sigma factor [Candidatus Competibacteraceae bacterium]